MDNVVIERESVGAVRSYIDRCPQMMSYIAYNDRTPIWDGDIFVYSSDVKTNAFFYGRVPVQVKGTEVTKFSEKKVSYSQLTRKDLENLRDDGGCIFFVVQVAENKSPRVFYCELSVAFITDLLNQKKKVNYPTFHLYPVPSKDDFQKLVANFSDARYKNLVVREIVEVEGLEKRIDKLLKSIHCIYNVKYSSHFSSYIAEIDAMKKERETIWKTIKDYSKHLTSTMDKIVDDASRAEINLHANYLFSDLYNCESKWMDKLLVLIPELIEKARGIIRKEDLYDCIYNYADFLHDQKKYHLIKDYFEQALQIVRENASSISDSWRVANTLNTLGILHYNLNRHKEAEGEYKEALKIRRELAKDNPDAYKGYVATTLNNLAVLHKNLNRHKEAEKEYKEALKIYRELAKDNPDAYKGDVATTLNNLAALHDDLNRHKEAEEEYKEALKIKRELAKDNPDAYRGYVATTLNNLGALHDDLNRHKEAEEEYKEALKIYRELAKDNPDAYKGDVAMTLNNYALLYAKEHDFTKAIDTIDEAIALMPEKANYYDSKGEILLMKGDEQGALAMWQKVMELDPDFLSKYNGETDFHRQLKERGLIDN